MIHHVCLVSYASGGPATWLCSLSKFSLHVYRKLNFLNLCSDELPLSPSQSTNIHLIIIHSLKLKLIWYNKSTIIYNSGVMWDVDNHISIESSLIYVTKVCKSICFVCRSVGVETIWGQTSKCPSIILSQYK